MRAPSDRLKFVPFQLPTLVERAPHGTGWIHEIKFDGYRTQLVIEKGVVRAYTRNGYDWTERYGTIVEAAERLPCRTAIIDGEAVVMGENGRPDFQSLRREMARGSSSRVQFQAFDLLYLDGGDLRQLPIIERKEALRELLDGIEPPITYVDHMTEEEADAETFYQHACKIGIEGIVSKRADAPYVSGRQETWLKRKCKTSDTFTIVAFVEKLGARPRRIASLYVGRQTDGGVVYAGKVETGFRNKDLRQIREVLDPLIVKESPLAVPVKKPKATWVRPVVQAEVSYATLTDAGLLRQAVFKGLREAPDLPAATVAEQEMERAPASRRARPENILQLLPDAVNPTKDQLREYWAKIADRALVHLGRRPLKLVRHVQGKTFYHKGPLPPIPSTVHQLKLKKREGGECVRVWVDDLAGLLGLVDMDVVEVHPWGAIVDDIERSDLLVFDLDPGKGVGYDQVIETATALRDILEFEEGLPSWPKLSGGKGIHVMVPLEKPIPADEAHEYSRKIADGMGRTAPNLYTTSAKLGHRPGRLFIDWLRNGRGTTAVGAYSPRARLRLPIAAPVTWEQVEDGIPPNAVTMTSVAGDKLGPARDDH
jgi:bifunctional non-homologous end joining protein LigD